MSEVIKVNTTVSDKAPTKPNFGTPMLVGFHTAWADRVREYSEASDMLDDGFTTDDDLYQMALIAKSQEPSPETFKVGRLEAATYTHTVNLTPTNFTEGLDYNGEIEDTEFSYVVQSGDAILDVNTGLVSEITAISDVTATDEGTHVQVVSDIAATILSFFGVNEHLHVEDVTAVVDADLQADLDAIKDEDNEWYGLALAVNSADAVSSASAWTEANDKIFVPQLSDTEVTDAGVTDDIASSLVALSYTRTGPIWHRHIGGSEWSNVAFLMANLIPDPGSYTPAFKTLAGVSVNKLRAGQETALEAKNVTKYTRQHGINVTFEGRTPSARFFDVTRFIDWQDATIKADAFGPLVNNPKIPFTNQGIATMRDTVEGSLIKGATAGGLDRETIVVTAPDVTATDSADRSNRLLKGIKAKARLAGALHGLEVEFNVSV